MLAALLLLNLPAQIHRNDRDIAANGLALRYGRDLPPACALNLIPIHAAIDDVIVHCRVVGHIPCVVDDADELVSARGETVEVAIREMPLIDEHADREEPIRSKAGSIPIEIAIGAVPIVPIAAIN